MELPYFRVRAHCRDQDRGLGGFVKTGVSLHHVTRTTTHLKSTYPPPIRRLYDAAIPLQALHATMIGNLARQPRTAVRASMIFLSPAHE